MTFGDPSRRGAHWAWWGPAVLAGVFLIVLAGLLWFSTKQILRERERDLRDSTDAMVRAVQDRLALTRASLESLGEGLGDGVVGEDGSRAEARRLMEGYRELLCVRWIDGGFTTQWQECRPGPAVPAGDGGVPAPPDDLLLESRMSGDTLYSRARPSSSGVSTFDIHIPVYRGDAFLGILGGVYSCDGLLQETQAGLRGRLAEAYRVSLASGGELLARLDRGEAVDSRLVEEVPLDPPGHDTVLTLARYGGTPWSRGTVFLILVSVALAVGMLSGMWAMHRQIRWRLQAEAELRSARDALEARVEQRTFDLSAANRRLSEEVAERACVEERLRRRTQDLNKRIQEMRCLFAVSDLVEQPDASLEDIVQGTVEMIPPAWQRPGQTAARVVLDGRCFSTATFRETSWRRFSEIVVRGEPAGVVEVCYLGAVDPDGPDPFLPEEQHLLDVIAERLARVVERVRADRDRTALQEQLHQAQKMEAIGQLAAGVAHDFRNVLTVVRGHAHQAADLLPPDHPAQEAVQFIRQAAAQANDLTQSLLTFSQSAPTRRQRIDLVSSVHEWSRLLQYMLPRSIQLKVDLHEGPVWIEADAGQLQQVLMNLVINARDAMPDGGVLEIAVVREKDTAATVGDDVGFSGRPVVRLIVRDSGTGIPPEFRTRVFEPFFTTKPRGRGTGLGLSIAHGIVRDHDGRIDVQSEEGRGTTMVVSLPGLSPAAEEVAAAAPIRRQAHGECVLLVADDPYVRGLMALTLQSAGYAVTQASDGRAGLAAWRQTRKDIRLVIIDDEHLSADGVLRSVCEEGGGTPVLCVTAGADAA
ncbi:MAG: hypothetical protein JXB13_21460, partial [Phycisphaerae bacterium]|nr:hypothetical protein [Phycisphaerae bacterium]